MEPVWFYAGGGLLLIVGLVLMFVFQNQNVRPAVKEGRVRQASYLFVFGLAIVALGWFVAMFMNE